MLIRITIRIQEFLTECKFYHCGIGEIVRILCDQLPWGRFDLRVLLFFCDTTPICFNWQLKVYECFDEDRPTDKHSKILSGHNVGLGVMKRVIL